MTKPLSTALDLIRQYGGPVSHAALDPSHTIFRTPDVDGLISYLLVCRCAVVQGDPICAPENKAKLADAFADYCAGKGWSILYVTATASLQAYARERGYVSLEFANLLMADPQDDPETGAQGRHLRQHLNHARRAGVIVREYLGKPDAQMEAQSQAACEAWEGGRHGLQMYLGRPRLFDDRDGRRWFIAEQAGKVIGFLSMLRVGCTGCQSLINLVFSSPTAPLYTNELMVATALGALREEGVGSVCMGVGPLEALGRIEGCGAIAEFLSRKLYLLFSTKLMHQHEKTVFWEKFRVTQREPLYLLFQTPRIRLREVYALLRALHFSVKG
ncbi:MAG: phosphatidylglycerol lysyltransferase domain-containing protein [Methylobacter sp.]|nr:phosphatidylglycerol lysyltransferase domain-containing protein [Methylobacter sp.]